MRIAFVLAAPFIVLIGCSSSGSRTAASGDSVRSHPKTLKVALLTPSPISDAGWSAMAYDGLTAIKQQMGAEVRQEEAGGEQKIKDSMRSYAQQGYDLVFGHGYEYNAPEIQIARDFPKTVFVSSSGDKTAANAGAFRFELEQGFYLAGVVAAKMDSHNTVGMVGGDKVPSIQSTFDAFKAGAKSVKPGIQVLQVYTGDGVDSAKAKDATLQLIGAGADFIIHQANAAAQGVFEACKEKNVYAFGANADQNANPSGIVIASAVIVARPAFLNLARQVQDGSYRGSVQKFGIKEGAIDFVLNPKLASKVPVEIQKLLSETKEKIKDGKLAVPEAKF